MLYINVLISAFLYLIYFLIILFCPNSLKFQLSHQVTDILPSFHSTGSQMYLPVTGFSGLQMSNMAMYASFTPWTGMM